MSLNPDDIAPKTKIESTFWEEGVSCYFFSSSITVTLPNPNVHACSREQIVIQCLVMDYINISLKEDREDRSSKGQFFSCSTEYIYFLKCYLRRFVNVYCKTC